MSASSIAHSRSTDDSSDAMVIPAAGSGSRMAGTVEDKILETVAGATILAHSLRAIRRDSRIRRLVVATRDAAQEERIAAILAEEGWDKEQGGICVPGGATRAESVHQAVAALPEPVNWVFVHDAARPLIRTEWLAQLRQSAENHGAAALARPLTDTLQRAPRGLDPTANPTLLEPVDRTLHWTMETPQCFRHRDLVHALESARRSGLHHTDEVSAARAVGIGVALVVPDAPNPKVTTPQDLAWIEFLLTAC